MPLPTPGDGEDHDAFIERCMSETADEFEDEGQRMAVCQSQWNDAQGNSDAAAVIPYPRLARSLVAMPWAIMPEAYAMLSEVVRTAQTGIGLTDAQISDQLAALSNGTEPRRPGASRIAVIPISGIISQKLDLFAFLFGGTSTEGLGRALSAYVNDETIDAVVLNIDSPGGSVFGVPEVADQITALRGKKPIVAVANSLAASAAYWIGSQADEFVVTPSGEVGSIGVIAAHLDESVALEQQGLKVTLVSAGKYKAEGSSIEPLAQETRDYLQSRVDDYYDAFVKAVARGRGVSPDAVRSGYGQGRLVGASAAQKAGMVDRVATLDETITRLTSPHSRAALMRRGTRDHSAIEVAPAGAQATEGNNVDTEARAALGLPPDADDQAVLDKIKALAALPPDPGYSAEDFRALQSQVGTMSAELARRDAESAVESAIRAGKVVPAQREWALGYAGTDLAGFKAYASTAPAFPLGAKGLEGDGSETAVSLTPEEIRIGAQLGNTPEKLLEAKRAQLSAR